MEQILSFFGALISCIFWLIWSVIKFIGTAIAVFIAFIIFMIIYRRIKGKKWHRSMQDREGDFRGPINLHHEVFASLLINGDAYLDEVVVKGVARVNGHLRIGNSQFNKLIVNGTLKAEESFFNEIEVTTQSTIYIKNCPFEQLTVRSFIPVTVELTGDTGTNIIFDGVQGEVVYVATVKD